MKKIITALLTATGIASGIFCAYATIASAQAYQFSNNLSVGATGTDVTTLQTWLIANGYHIPSIESGAASKGRFGSETKRAVQAYQTASKLPSTGFVGPLTRASLNGAAQKTNVPVATASSTAPQMNVQAPAMTISTKGITGTLAVTLWNSPANGTVVYKGQSYDVAAYKLQASASDMAVQSVSLDFNARLWLYASAITIRDDSGAVVSQVTNLGSSNFTELTVGSDYRINIPVMNYVVKASQTRYFTVNATFLGTSDRTTGNIGVTAVQIRSVDGTGVTDTEPTIAVATRTFSYQGSGAGLVIITVDAKSPPNMLVPISTGVPTYNIPMGVLDFKAQNQDGVFRTLSIYFNTSADTTTNVSTIFKNIKIQSGNQIYPANSIQYSPAGSIVTFTNMNIALPKDQSVPVAILLDVNPDTNHALNGISASSTLLASGTSGGTSNNPEIEDSSFNPIAINSAPFLSSDITFSDSDANLFSGTPTAVLGNPVTGNNNNTTGYNVSFSFPITAGNNSLYVSANPNIALATSSTGFGSTASSSLPLAGVITSPGSLSGDSNVSALNGYYVIPAGSTRTFTFNGSMDNTNGAKGFKTLAITGVNYGTTTSALNANTIVYYNYGVLKVTATF